MSLAVSMVLLGSVAGGGGSNIHSGVGTIALGLGLSGAGVASVSGTGTGTVALGLSIAGAGRASATTGAGSISLNTAVSGVGAAINSTGIGAVSLGIGLAGVGSGGGGGGNLTSLTLLTTDGTNIAANSGFEFGVPVAPGGLNGSNYLQIVDGSNNVIGYAQEDNRVTDLNGDVRFSKYTGTIITAPGANNLAATLKTTPGSPLTTNPISIANLLAQTIAGDTFECKVTCTFPNGDVYIALATDALQASSAWTYGSAQYRGTFRSGPLCTEWICSAPLVHSGTPHPFLTAQFHISAYKALPGAWNNTTNPITGVKCTVILENGYATVANPADLVYDLLIQTGASTLATGLQLNGSSPATTLTLSSVSGQVFADRSTGTWNAASTTLPNSQDAGKAIVEIGGNGRGFLMGLSNATRSWAFINPDTSFSSTTKTSGQWRTMGVYHYYMGRVDNYWLPIWWGASQNVVAALPTTYIKASEMVMNYGADAVSVGAPDLSACNADGSHPMAMRLGASSIKNFSMQEASSGDTDHIGVLSYSFCAALLNWSYSTGQHLNARSLCLQNSRVGNLKPFFIRDETTGGTISIDSAGCFVYSTTNNNGKGIPINAYNAGSSWYGFAGNHSGGASCLPYLMTGDFMHLETGAVAGNNYSLTVTQAGLMSQTPVTFPSSGFSVTMPSGYPQQTGEQIIIDWGNGSPPILNGGGTLAKTYFVHIEDSTHISLYDTRAHALAGGSTGRITWSNSGIGTNFQNGYFKNGITAGANDAQPRATAWNWRTIAQQLMVFPDTIAAGLVDPTRTQANLRRQLDAMGTYLKTTYTDDVNYQAGGPRYLSLHSSGGNSNSYATWQNNYLRLAGNNGQEAGVNSAASTAFFDWFLADSIQWIANSTTSSPYFMPAMYYVRAQSNAQVNQYTYSGVYQESIRSPIAVSQSCQWRQTSQTATISNVSNQAAVTIVYAQNFFDVANSSRHIGSWVVVGSGCGQITSVIDAKTCVADTTVMTWDNSSSGASSFSTGVGQSCVMPLPSAGNAGSIVGTAMNYGSSNVDGHYVWLANSGKEIAYQRGIGTGNYAAAVAFISSIGLPDNPPPFIPNQNPTAIKGNVAHR